jgi:hypothetical protein
VVEEELNCRNYHLRVNPYVGAGDMAALKKGQLHITEEIMEDVVQAGFSISVFGDDDRKGEPEHAEAQP